MDRFFFRFVTIHAFVRRTERQTDRQNSHRYTPCKLFYTETALLEVFFMGLLHLLLVTRNSRCDSLARHLTSLGHDWPQRPAAVTSAAWPVIGVARGCSVCICTPQGGEKNFRCNLQGKCVSTPTGREVHPLARARVKFRTFLLGG